jgi:hypothetical protein
LTHLLSLCRLDDALEKEIPLPGLDAAAARAADLMAPKAAEMATAIQNAKSAVAAAELKLSEVVEAEKEEDDDEDDAEPAETTRLSKKRKGAQRRNYADDAAGRGGGGVTAAPPAGAVDDRHQAAIASLAKAKKDFALRQKEGREWKEAVVAVTKEEFVELGHAVVKPGYDYYMRLYNTPGSELFALKQAFRGASVFDPLKLKDLSFETASLLVDDLAKFRFPEFTDKLLDGMKKELPELIRQAKTADLSGVTGAEEYDASLARKLKHKEAKAAKAARPGEGGGGVSSSSSSSAPQSVVVEEAVGTTSKTSRGGGCQQVGRRPNGKIAQDLGVVEDQSEKRQVLHILADGASSRCPRPALQRVRGARLLTSQANYRADWCGRP